MFISAKPDNFGADINMIANAGARKATWRQKINNGLNSSFCPFRYRELVQRLQTDEALAYPLIACVLTI